MIGLSGANGEHLTSPSLHAAGTVGAVLRDAALAAGDKCAVITAAGVVSYAELYTRSVDAARSLGVDIAGHPVVAVRQDGSIEAIIQSFAVMMAGCRLLSIDVQLPQRRADNLIRTAAAVELNDDIGSMPESGGSLDEYFATVVPDDAALIGFTSGSTGVPKGLILSHRMCLAKAHDVARGQALRDADVLANLLPLGFGAGITTLLAAIVSRATVICTDPRRQEDIAMLLRYLTSQRATTIHVSVSLARTLADTLKSDPLATPPLIRMVTLYGESPTGADVRALHAVLPGVAVVNWYATTEAGAITHRIFTSNDAIGDGRLPAGQPLTGRTILVVDEAGQPVPTGAVGEVVAIGGCFADRYVTESVTRPDTGGDEMTRYYTGDRGYLNESGILHLTGRTDDVVKIRGYFVDPSEVEAVLRKIDGVTDVAVLPDGDRRVDLVAYVVVARSSSGYRLSETEIRGELRRELPTWMVPRFIQLLDQLPRTERGKVDRSALRARDVVPAKQDSRFGRRTRTTDLIELRVRGAVYESLGREDIDRDEDLLQAGADSLMLSTLALKIRQSLHADVDLAAFIDSPSIATLCQIVREQNTSGPGMPTDCSEIVPLKTDGAGAPLFFVIGAGAPAVSMLPTVRHLDIDRPVYVLQARGLESRARADRTITNAARRYISLIQKIQPQGPYTLGGHSWGGVVALEMAAQLAEKGQQTSMMLAVDVVLNEARLAGLSVAVTNSDRTIHDTADSYRPSVRLSAYQTLRIVVGQMTAGLIQFDPLTQWTIFYLVGMRMLAKHRIRQIEAPIAVLRTAQTRQPEAWWRAITTDSVTFRDVPGTHVGLLREPYAKAVAEEINEQVRSHSEMPR